MSKMLISKIFFMQKGFGLVIKVEGEFRTAKNKDDLFKTRLQIVFCGKLDFSVRSVDSN